MLFDCRPKVLHKHCLQFLLGVKMAPRETENNAYAKFWGDKQRTLWYVTVFLEWSIGWGYRGRGSPLVPIQANRFMGHSEIYRQPWIKDKYKKIKWEGKLSASADGKTTSRFQRIAWLRRAPGKAMESIFSMGKYWDKTISSWTTFCRYDNVKINRMRCTDETNKCWLWPWRFNSQPKWLKNYTKKFFSFI